MKFEFSVSLKALGMQSKPLFSSCEIATTSKDTGLEVIKQQISMME
jgi:hypothetical protein